VVVLFCACRYAPENVALASRFVVMSPNKTCELGPGGPSHTRTYTPVIGEAAVCELPDMYASNFIVLMSQPGSVLGTVKSSARWVPVPPAAYCNPKPLTRRPCPGGTAGGFPPTVPSGRLFCSRLSWRPTGMQAAGGSAVCEAPLLNSVTWPSAGAPTQSASP